MTLGPTGICHERAATEYVRFRAVDDFEVSLIGDFRDGLEWIRGKQSAFLIHRRVHHPLVHKVTGRHWSEVFVVDSLFYPTTSLPTLSRAGHCQPGFFGQTSGVA